MPRLTTAIILAAGLGSRLQSIHASSPKGLLTIGGQTLVERSLNLLQQHGIERVVIVTGHMRETYEALAAQRDDVDVVHNAAFATTGSMASLVKALAVVQDDFLLLESDLLYETRALSTLLDHAEPNVVLMSGPTGAGDEVWVEGKASRLVDMAKDGGALRSVAGEFVGINRISAGLAARMHEAFVAFVDQHGHGQMSYETDALVSLAATEAIALSRVDDLRWGEIDDPSHYRRVVTQLWPEIARHEQLAGAPTRAVLLNPGPATTTDTVKRAMMMTDVCPREVSFTEMMADVRQRLAALVAPTGWTTIPFAASGTAAVEAVLASVVPPDKELLILDNGDYGTRMTAICVTLGVPHQTVDVGWGKPIDVAAVGEILTAAAGRISHVAAIHHETSSGLLNPLAPLAEVVHANGASLILDAMSSFAARPIGPLPGLDYIISSANKCIQGMAGISFVIARLDALEAARAAVPRAFYLDLVAQYDKLEASGQTRFTCPPQVLSALAQALTELESETVAGRHARYDACYQVLYDGIERLGFEFLLPDADHSRILMAIREPSDEWYDFVAIHDALFERGFTIYPGKTAGGASFRLSVLGALYPSDIAAFLFAFEDVIAERKAAVAVR
ncbi:MAG: 2-aminoethylphosphonate--pyruvate transaminase [Myxococcales bacterium]|nr:2-aminoethylphosphonate--pyruvate transaminase [Myxococcales bacterium]